MQWLLWVKSKNRKGKNCNFRIFCGAKGSWSLKGAETNFTVYLMFLGSHIQKLRIISKNLLRNIKGATFLIECPLPLILITDRQIDRCNDTINTLTNILKTKKKQEHLGYLAFQFEYLSESPACSRTVRAWSWWRYQKGFNKFSRISLTVYLRIDKEIVN